MSLFSRRMPSPVGGLTLVGTASHLVAILWENDRPGRVPLGPVETASEVPVLRKTERQLREYFAGERRVFELPLAFRGTDFQRRVWAALLTIPYGETRTYGAVATALGDPKSVRAVGAANGRNPISIVAPCHRVIGASGDLTGFAGGLDTKRRLLALEAAHAPGGLFA